MSDTALLVIDMFTDYQHPDGDELAENVADILDPLDRLLTEASAHDGVEVVYVNDNHEDFSAGRQDRRLRAVLTRQRESHGVAHGQTIRVAPARGTSR